MTTFLTRKALRFFSIVGGGIIVALILWLATNVLNIPLPGTDTSPIDLRVVVAPAAFDWASEAAERFNAEDHRQDRRPITVHVTEQDGLSLYAQANATALNPPPAAWIAEGAFTLDLVNLAARQASGQEAFEANGSVAQSALMWGGFADRVSALDARFGGLTWSALQNAAIAQNGWSSLGGRPEWGFFKLVLPDPRKSAEGLAALLAAAAEFHNKTDVGPADINDVRFQQWAQSLIGAVPNFATLGVEPASALAVRGPSVGDAGLLLESDWLRSATSAFTLRYASTAIVFDFPFAVWVGAETNATPDAANRRQAERQAALQFHDYLLQDAQQRRVEAFGLRPASGTAANGQDSLFARWASLGVQSGRPATAPVKASADAVQAALRWAERAAGR
ncbi:MAG TPA: substrate-binding domain-containing protein [Anaerolineae bacterium]